MELTDAEKEDFNALAAATLDPDLWDEHDYPMLKAARAEHEREQAQEAEPQNERADEIASLWAAHVIAKNTARATKDELRDIRAKLGEHLHEMKTLLVSPGRDGRWSGFLREHEIPKATADRLVRRHQRSIDPDANLLIEAISEPTEKEVETLFKSILPRLRRTLRSRQSLDLFVKLLTSEFERSEATDREILVPTPTALTICPASADQDFFVETEVCTVTLVADANEQVI
jgi:hypothetical protein